MMKLGILGSKNGTDLQAIIEAEKTNKLKATINVVISNMENVFSEKTVKIYIYIYKIYLYIYIYIYIHLFLFFYI